MIKLELNYDLMNFSKDMPKISVIVPVYNAEKTLSDTIESVLNQTYGNWELFLIVDGKSKDQSLQMTKNFSKKDPRIHCYHDQNIFGVAANRNFGISKSNSQYVSFLDSDDIWLPTKLEKQIHEMVKDNSDFSCTSYAVFKNNVDNVIVHRYLPKFLDYNSLLAHNPIGCSTVMIRTDLFKTFSFQEAPHEDFALWLSMFKQGVKISLLSEILVLYRIQHYTRSSNKIKAAYNRWLIIREFENKSVYISLKSFMIYIIKSIYIRLLN